MLDWNSFVKIATTRGKTIFRDVVLRAKLCANWGYGLLGKEPPFKLTFMDKVGRGRSKLGRLFRILPATVKAAVIATGVIFSLLLVFGKGFDAEGVTTEFWGLLAEIIVLGIVVFYVSSKSEQSQFVQAQYDLIDDFKYWESDEAKSRILGAMRRLQRLGISKFDLCGIRMSSVKVKEYGISDLRGSELSGKHWMSSIGIRTDSKFNNIDFDDCYLAGVKFSISTSISISGQRTSLSPNRGAYIDCSFRHCDMTGCSFDEAILEATEKPAKDGDRYDYIADNDDGSPAYAQVEYGEFYEANLSNASFVRAELRNIDFRQCFNVETADFAGAVGLETCVFDTDAQKEAILTQSKQEVA